MERGKINVICDRQFNNGWKWSVSLKAMHCYSERALQTSCDLMAGTVIVAMAISQRTLANPVKSSKHSVRACDYKVSFFRSRSKQSSATSLHVPSDSVSGRCVARGGPGLGGQSPFGIWQTRGADYAPPITAPPPESKSYLHLSVGSVKCKREEI